MTVQFVERRVRNLLLDDELGLQRVHAHRLLRERKFLNLLKVLSSCSLCFINESIDFENLSLQFEERVAELLRTSIAILGQREALALEVVADALDSIL